MPCLVLITHQTADHADLLARHVLSRMVAPLVGHCTECALHADPRCAGSIEEDAAAHVFPRTR